MKKTQFFIILFISTGILCFQTAQCVDKFFLKATGTADKYVHVSKTSFPILTVCPTYPYKLDRLQHHGVETKSDIQFGAEFSSKIPGVTPQEFYEDVVLKVEDIIEDVDIYAEVEIDGKNKFLVRPNETICGEYLFKTKQYYYNGDCFALQLPDCLKNGGVLEIVFDFFNKTDIFIHHDGQFLSPNSRSRVDVELGYFVKIAVNHEVVQLLSDDGNCVDQYSEDEGVDSDMDNSFDGCMYSKLRQIMTDDVGCNVPWLPDKSNICTDHDDQVRAFTQYQNNRRNQHDVCPMSCRFTNMYFGPPVTGRQNVEVQNVARGIFYFRRDIKTTTEYYLYSVLSMLAEIGGYVGLLLGVSLFKLADFNNMAIDYMVENQVADLEDTKQMSKSITKNVTTVSPYYNHNRY